MYIRQSEKTSRDVKNEPTIFFAARGAWARLTRVLLGLCSEVSHLSLSEIRHAQELKKLATTREAHVQMIVTESCAINSGKPSARPRLHRRSPASAAGRAEHRLAARP